jgi:CRP-like cAMP-binding protein
MLDTLAEISFFEGLTSRQLELISPLFETYRCPASIKVFEQGEKAVFLYLIIRGNALIQYKPYDGPPITLSRLKPGDAFGWSAAVGSPTYSSAILTTEPMEAIRIRGTDLVRLCREHPTAGSVILNRLAHGVSGRWRDARVQVKAMLKDGVEHSAEHSAEA